ncbi:MAG: TonB-dependent receptor [Cyclobacteriaceae bacterium]|nr:TonB-dependent receptor [Cyclobacteriaceae bacterium]
MIRRSFIVCLLALFAYQVANAQQGLRGIVLDSENQQAVENVLVRISGQKQGASTDVKGAFYMDNLAEGEYSLTFSHLGYHQHETIVKVPFEGVLQIALSPRYYMADQVVVEATRADENTPTTYVNVLGEEIKKQNFGQDVPYMLENTPSLVTTSDAGAGVGYTGMRIRGSDMTRINVTINGIPVNDSESQGVYWVNTPDLLSSTSSIQVQRGVGTSTNGAAAFGATINMQTNELEEEAYSELNNTVGSFNTLKNTLKFGTGLINGHWSFDGRLSRVSSEGYIQRATSNLQSYYLAGGYYGEKTTIKAISFAGKEVTYQAWWGTPEARLTNDLEGMNFVADMNWYSTEQRDNLLNSGRTFNYYLYENEVDNYMQDHNQLHISHAFNKTLTAYVALHYTYGRGYYEQFKEGEDFADYDLTEFVTVGGVMNTTDLIRRRWLDNHFYGLTYSVQKENDRTKWVLGGGWNNYEGSHFGEIIWAQFSPNQPKNYRYYDNDADKRDFNTYLKVTRELMPQLIFFGDVQYRGISYQAQGPDNDRVGGVPKMIDVAANYNFFNPKAGFTWQLNDEMKVYSSYALANREPVRTDFIDNQDGTTPRPEQLHNVELGMKIIKQHLHLQANMYYMGYNDQLVMTGEVNDVGSPIRKNVEDSYRSGIEVSGNYEINSFFDIGANLTLSANKIKEFREIIYDYGVAWDEFNVIENIYTNPDIAFSPAVIGGGIFSYKPKENVEFAWMVKYVGNQYLDNTSNENRKIDPYLTNHLRVSYSLYPKWMKEVNMGLLLNNVLNEWYESNGYTFGYRGGGLDIRENYYYPQAGRNFLLSANLRF